MRPGNELAGPVIRGMMRDQEIRIAALASPHDLAMCAACSAALCCGEPHGPGCPRDMTTGWT